MLEHMKMLHIEFPQERDDDLLPVEEVFDLKPSTILRGARYKEELTQAELAKRTGISLHRIRDMEHGRRPIDEETAKILGKALNIGHNVFL